MRPKKLNIFESFASIFWKLDSLDSYRISKVKFSGFDTLCTGLYNPKILLKHSDGLVVWSHYVTKYYFQARVFSTLVKWINLSLNIVTRIKTLLSSGRPKLTKIGFP